MTLLLPEAARDGIVAHAREGAPEEVVGVLAGDREADRSVVARTLRADNAADAPGVVGNPRARPRGAGGRAVRVRPRPDSR